MKKEQAEKESKAPTVSDTQQLQFTVLLQAMELTRMRAEQAEGNYNQLVSSMQVRGYYLRRDERGRLSYVLATSE